MTKPLSICFVGLGSIGKRHVRNLAVVCERRGLAVLIDALRSRPSPLEEDVARLIHQQYMSAAELPVYDMMYICNPSQLHYETLLRLKDNASHFLVEKPVFVRPVSDEQLKSIDDAGKYYVACPLRHTRVFAFLREFVAKNRIFSARAICSSYLPDWRPGQDYRKLYSAERESGGVKVDLVHEFDYLFTLFGFPQRSFLSEGKFSNLEIASSDTVAYIGEYVDKTLELHLDYHGRQTQRSVELYTSDDVVRCDFLKSEIRFLKSGEIKSLAEERDDYCRREEDYFLDFSQGERENINSIAYANRVLREIWR